MALFQQADGSRDEEVIGGSDAASRALSVTAVETDFVEGVYEKLASVYDWFFGPTLHRRPSAGHAAHGDLAGRPHPRSRRRHRDQPVAVSADCELTGIDLSDSMLEKAYERVAEKRMRNVHLQQMDASASFFPTPPSTSSMRRI